MDFFSYGKEGYPKFNFSLLLFLLLKRNETIFVFITIWKFLNHKKMV